MRLANPHALLLSSLCFLSWAPAVRAQGSTDPQFNQRCATRLAIAFTGAGASTALLQSTNPQGQVAQLLTDPNFIEQFARFINATFNDLPADLPEQDASYWLTKYILENGKTWDQLFIGPYHVDKAPDGGAPMVYSDPNGLGYFRSMPWEIEYAGNEPAGYKLRTAYRMMNNIIGLHLIPATNAPGADISATGRQAPACAGCHYNPIFGLDYAAHVLTRKQGSGNNITFAPPSPSDIPQTLLAGITVSNDSDLVHALVNSTNFQFRACRLAFLYLYGRPEATCEGPIFDSCMAAFKASGTIQSALQAVATDSSYCQ
jgi:hypothetical protein